MPRSEAAVETSGPVRVFADKRALDDVDLANFRKERPSSSGPRQTTGLQALR